MPGTAAAPSGDPGLSPGKGFDEAQGMDAVRCQGFSEGRVDQTLTLQPAVSGKVVADHPHREVAAARGCPRVPPMKVTLVMHFEFRHRQVSPQPGLDQRSPVFSAHGSTRLNGLTVT